VRHHIGPQGAINPNIILPGLPKKNNRPQENYSPDFDRASRDETRKTRNIFGEAFYF